MSAHKTHINATCPVRVDLAGGTVDIWPIYLLLEGARTINYGINLFAQTEIIAESSNQPQVTLESTDQGAKVRLSWEQVLDPQEQGSKELTLLLRLLRKFSEKHPNPTSLDLTLRTRALSPAGAGLGGSSALSISIIGALSRWVHPNQPLDLDTEGDALIALTRDVESQVLFGPAGLQDYYGAAFGGLQVLRWGLGSNERESLPVATLRKLASRTLLFYSGKSRNSGINNWQLYKNFIDRDPATTQKFEAIVRATAEVEIGLAEQNFDAVIEAVTAEWSARKTLASGISTPEMEHAWGAVQKITKSAFKVCGAGGGGCFFVLLPTDDPMMKPKVIQTVTSIPGIQSLPFEPVAHGLDVKVKFE